MYKFSVSVRTYHTGRKYGLPSFEEWNKLPSEVMQAACLKAADSVLANHRGKKTAIELYRAAGLGVYQIGLIMCGESVDVDYIRKTCEYYDKYLHMI